MKRNAFIYVFKFIQLLFVAVVTMSVFFRSTLHHNTIDDGGLYLGALYFSMVIILFNGFMEVSMLVAKLPVLYKHRDLHFYPSWVYTIPSWASSVPNSFIESGFWVAITYYVIGFDPSITRFCGQFLAYFLLHQMSIALFRLMGSLGRNMMVANTFVSFAMLVVKALGGYIISKDRTPKWWIWGFWFSPLMYAQNAASVNEFLGHKWDKAFVEEVMELVELTQLNGALVGLPGVHGLSTEQRKRLTIAVELFMDEPTSGLDARSAAIVRSTVRNIVNTGRTSVCTIHQPSIDIFESLDDLQFLKRGGESIYAGPLGPKSCEFIKYFEAVEGVEKIWPGYNPPHGCLMLLRQLKKVVLGWILQKFSEVLTCIDITKSWLKT